MHSIPDKFTVQRDVGKGVHKLDLVFSGLQHSPAIIKLFGNKNRAIQFLDAVKMRVTDGSEYMYVDPWDGYIVTSRGYLSGAESRILYLDVIHELVHVKQRLEGKDLYDRRYSYIDRPTELEGYAVVVEEGQRIGMTSREIVEYLQVPWISEKDSRLLARKLGVDL
jgi:hypothetical protein